MVNFQGHEEKEMEKYKWSQKIRWGDLKIYQRLERQSNTNVDRYRIININYKRKRKEYNYYLER